MKDRAHSGKYLNRTPITKTVFSIIMEFADDGDVFQRICECQNNKQFMKEKHIWKIII